MRRYKLVLTRHENFSVRVDGLVSMIYLDVSPTGFILNCYKAITHSDVFAVAEPSNMIFDDSVPTALVIQFVEVDEHLKLCSNSATATNDISAIPIDLNQLKIIDSIPDLDVYLNFYTDKHKTRIDATLDDTLLTLIRNAKGDIHMILDGISAKSSNVVFAQVAREALQLLDTADATVLLNFDADISKLRINARPAATKAYLPYYVFDWADFDMSDLEDMTMDEMMYGEVIE